MTTREVAMRFPVSGYVKNLPDGRVEVVVEGPDADVVAFIKAVEQAMAGFVRGVDVTPIEASGRYDGFGIRH